MRRIFETSVFCAILATACSTAITPQEGCHAKGGSSPRLETLTQWTNNKDEIRSEVKNGSMPRKKTLTSEERTALLKYINTL